MFRIGFLLIGCLRLRASFSDFLLWSNRQKVGLPEFSAQGRPAWIRCLANHQHKPCFLLVVALYDYLPAWKA